MLFSLNYKGPIIPFRNCVNRYFLDGGHSHGKVRSRGKRLDRKPNHFKFAHCFAVRIRPAAHMTAALMYIHV
jgi:hypothetical protein